MQWKGTPRAKYYDKYERVEVPKELEHSWFETYKLGGGVYVVAEPDNYQEVRFFIVPGEEKSLIFDTGMGIYPSKPLVEYILKKADKDPNKIIVVNSHCHFDHVGCNSDFFSTSYGNAIYGAPTKASESVANQGVPNSKVWSQVEDSVFRSGIPEDFDAANYHIEPYNFKALKDSDIIDLGNRKFEVIFTPGHSDDSLMLLDKENNVLLTGDTFYMGPLYAYFSSDEYGQANLEDYHKSLAKVCEMIDDNTLVYPSHNDFKSSKSDLTEARDLFEGIISGKIKGDPLPDEEDLYLNIVLRLQEVRGKNFSIIYPR